MQSGLMQPGHLTSYEETAFHSKLKKELKENTGNIVKIVASGMRNETEKGAKEIAVSFTNWLKDMDNGSFEFNKLEVGPQAGTLYQLIEKQNLAFQTIIEKFTRKVTGDKECDFSAVDSARQEIILFEIGKYLERGIEILTNVVKALKWSFRCIVLIFVSISIYQIYKSDNRLKEMAKLVINTGVGYFCGVIGSQVGGLIGVLGGPIGLVVGSIIGGMFGGIIGRYFGKGIFKLVCMIFFPKNMVGQGQPPIKGTHHIYYNSCNPDAVAIMKQTEVHGTLPKGPPKIPGAEAVVGLPKLF